MSDQQIQQRKQDHLRIVADGGASHCGSTLLECVRLTHCALPELALEQVDTSAAFFGKTLKLPLMISSMTGGVELAGKLNHGLAAAAAESGIAFATGSQRVLLNHPETQGDFAVRKAIPDGVLLGNIGGQQLLQYTMAEITSLVERLEADGLCVHLNPAHELSQPEGDRDFRGVLEAITRLNERLEGQVLVKEVGHGLSAATAAALADAGIRWIDIAGAGGTSWTKVEALREGTAESIGQTFADWGIPTALAVARARAVCNAGSTVIASGGIRSGLDMARAIALGAGLCGAAQPVLAAWLAGGQQGVKSLIERYRVELASALLLTGSSNLAALREARRDLAEPLRGLLENTSQ